MIVKAFTFSNDQVKAVRLIARYTINNYFINICYYNTNVCSVLLAVSMILQTGMQYSKLLRSVLARMRQRRSWIVHPLLHHQLLPIVAIFLRLFRNQLLLPTSHLHNSRHLINHLIQGDTLLPLLRGDIHLLPKEHIRLGPLVRGPTHPLRGDIHLPPALQLVMASHHQEGLIFNLVLEGPPEDLLFLSSSLEKSTCSLVSEDSECLQGIFPFRPTQHSLHHGHERNCS
jgi:hypothetical protein